MHKWKLRLESLDGRIVPDATPLVPPGIQLAPTQTSQQATVTDVAVIPQVDDLGNLTNTAIILEKADNIYFVTFFNQTTNTFYTGTDSSSTTLAFNAIPELDQLMAAAGVRGSLTDLINWTGAGQPQPGVPATTAPAQQLFMQTLAQLPGGQPPPAAQLGQPNLNEPAARLLPVDPNALPPAGGNTQYVPGSITVIQVQNGSIIYYQRPVWFPVQPTQQVAPPPFTIPGPVYTGPGSPWAGPGIYQQPTQGVVPLQGGFGIPFGRTAPIRPTLFPRR